MGYSRYGLDGRYDSIEFVPVPHLEWLQYYVEHYRLVSHLFVELGDVFIALITDVVVLRDGLGAGGLKGVGDQSELRDC